MNITIKELEDHLCARRLPTLELINLCRDLHAPFRAHPLGFISCTFITEGAFNARLHIWPVNEKTIQDEDIQIHDHVFDFQSWVLTGQIQNTELSISTDGELFAMYSTSYVQNKSTLKKLDKSIRIKPTKKTLHLAGSMYSIKAGQLHQTQRIGRDTAVTVLITQATSLPHPTVLGPIDGPDIFEYQRTEVTENILDSILSSISQS